MAAKQQTEAAAVERERTLREHLVSGHIWKNDEYVLNYTHLVRECRVCGFAEIRKNPY